MTAGLGCAGSRKRRGGTDGPYATALWPRGVENCALTTALDGFGRQFGTKTALFVMPVRPVTTQSHAGALDATGGSYCAEGSPRDGKALKNAEPAAARSAKEPLNGAHQPTQHPWV